MTACTMLFATSCQNEEIIGQQESNMFRLEVQKMGNSRTAIADDGTVTWSEGDKLFVYGDNGAAGTLFLEKEDVGSTNGTFIGFVKGDLKDLKYVAYGDGLTQTKEGVKVTLDEITLPNNNAPMFAELNPNNLGSVTLENVCGVVRINIVGLPENAVVSLEGKGIAGTATFKEDAKTLVADDKLTVKTIKVKGAKDSYHIDIPVYAGGTIEKIYVNEIPCDITDVTVTAKTLDASSIPTLNLKGNSMVETAPAVKTVDDLKAAANAKGAVVTVAAGNYGAFKDIKPAEDVKIICEEGTVFKGLSKLNINGATVVGATFVCDWENDSYTVADQTINGVFKNCVFDSWNALRQCYAGETVEFEDCVFKGGNYAVHFDGGKNDITFRRCTLSGFNTFGAAVTMLTFEDCKFVHDTTGLWESEYNGANLWGSTKFINCEFTFDGSTAYEWIDCYYSYKVYTFDNCTINGIKYTVDNAKEYEKYIDSCNKDGKDVTVIINGENYTFKLD